MSIVKNFLKVVAAQTVVGVAVNVVEKNIIEPVKDKVKEVVSRRKNKDNHYNR